MLTQNSSNASINSMKLLGTYLDYVEETPNDVQKYLSKCKEIDYKTNSKWFNSSLQTNPKNVLKFCPPPDFTSEIEKLSEQILALPSTSTDKKSRLKTRLHTILVKLMELKDEKIHLSQLLAASIDGSYKAVVDSLQSHQEVKRERSVSPTPSLKNNSSNSAPQSFTNNTVKPSAASNASSETNSASESQEKGTKRARKTRIDNLEMDDDDDPLPPVSTSSKLNVQPSQASAIAVKRATNANATKQKAKKRKTTKKQATAQIAQETIDEIIIDDPDETTYCICQQISYGEMVCCENDACPIEWFHFSCVDLVSKPKGRW